MTCCSTQKYLLFEALETAPLLPEQKTYFTARYMDLVQRYRQKYRRVNLFYNTLRVTVMVGSIFIPALLTLQKDPTTVISLTTYWVVFGLSLCVTLSNSMLELFNVAALNTKYWLHVHRLETEGWQFLHLTDSYSKYESVQDAFQKFTLRVEKLNLSLVFDLLRLENKSKTNPDNKVDGAASNSAGMSVGGTSITRERVTNNAFGLDIGNRVGGPSAFSLDVVSNDSSHNENNEINKSSLTETIQLFKNRLYEAKKEEEENKQ